MAANPIVFPGGLGGTTGDDPLATAKNVYVYSADQNVYFVDSATGDDTNAGEREDPYKTISQALSVAGSGDVIVVFAGHTETVTAAETIASRVTIIGEGAGTSRPLLTPNVAANGDMWTITAAAQIRGLRFAASAQANTSPTLDASAAGAIGCRISYCDFDCGDDDDGNKVHMNGGIVENCVFTASGTTRDTRPSRALTGARWVFGTTFTGGTYGWANTNSFTSGWDNAATGPVGLVGATGFSVIQCAVSGGAYFDFTATPDYHWYPEGLKMTGHPLISGAGLFLSGDTSVRYVNTTGGSDAAGFGKSVGQPYATLKYAVNTAAPTGLIVVAQSHTETIDTAAIVVDQAGCIIVGEGTGTNRPKFTRNWNGIAIDLDNATEAALCNITFAQSGTSSTAARINVQDPGFVIHQCDFDCGANDAAATILADAPLAKGDDLYIWSCSFTSTATTNTTVPVHAIDSEDTDNLLMKNCTFDGGAHGWSLGMCARASAAELFCENLTLLRNSMFVVEPESYAVAIEAIVQVSKATGTSGVISQPIN